MKNIKKRKLQIFRFLIQLAFMFTMIFSLSPGYNDVGKWLFITILLVGVFFCGWVCPFGTIQDWLFRIARTLHLPQYRVPVKFQRYLQLSRYVFYALSIMGISFAIINARSIFNHKLFTGTLTVTAGIVLAVFLIASLFINRPFCNYFCLKGASYGLLSVLRPLGIKREEENCIHCHLCDKNCPMNIPIESSDFIRHPNCINCMTCVSNCPKQCIKFRLKNKL